MGRERVKHVKAHEANVFFDMPEQVRDRAPNVVGVEDTLGMDELNKLPHAALANLWDMASKPSESRLNFIISRALHFHGDILSGPVVDVNTVSPRLFCFSQGRIGARAQIVGTSRLTGNAGDSGTQRQSPVDARDLQRTNFRPYALGD
jgi:hypothetical protein